MTHAPGRRPGFVVLVFMAVAVAVAATAFGVLVWRTRPEAVGPRFGDALVAKFPGATIDAFDGGVLRVALASGLYVDLRLASVFERCAEHRTACGDAIDGGVADVDRVVAATTAPRPEMLEPIVVADATPGFRLGYVTEPLVQPLELRHALVAGVASTFVTGAIADRLGMNRARLHDAALARLRRDTGATLEPDADGIAYRVRSSGDAVASLIDPERMGRFASQLQTRRLYAAVPSPGVLYVAAGTTSGLQALRQRVARRFGTALSPGQIGVIACDIDAPAGAMLSLAPTGA